ncbi:hypothetical protein ACVI55_007175 [Sinorhizobium medicae]
MGLPVPEPDDESTRDFPYSSIYQRQDSRIPWTTGTLTVDYVKRPSRRSIPFSSSNDGVAGHEQCGEGYR